MKVRDLKKVCDEFYIEEREGVFQENPVLASFPSAYDDHDIVKIMAKGSLRNPCVVVQVVTPTK